MRLILILSGLLALVSLGSLLTDPSALNEGGMTDRCIVYTEMLIELEPESLDLASFEALLLQYREEAVNSVDLIIDGYVLRILRMIRVISDDNVIGQAIACREFWLADSER